MGDTIIYDPNNKLITGLAEGDVVEVELTLTKLAEQNKYVIKTQTLIIKRGENAEPKTIYLTPQSNSGGNHRVSISNRTQRPGNNRTLSKR